MEKQDVAACGAGCLDRWLAACYHRPGDGGAVWISLTSLPIARTHATGRRPPVKVGGWLRSIDSIHLRIEGFIWCPIAQNLTGKRICPKLNRQDIICAIRIHTFALGQTTADQAIMIFNAAFFPGTVGVCKVNLPAMHGRHRNPETSHLP